MGFVHHLINKLEHDESRSHHPHDHQQHNGDPSAPPVPLERPQQHAPPLIPPRNYERAPMPPPPLQQQQQQRQQHYQRTEYQLPEYGTVQTMKSLNINGSNNIFSPIDTPDVSRVFANHAHPVPLPNNTYDDFTNRSPLHQPIETNSFYTNLLLDNQTAPIWTHPYSMWYTNKPEETEFFGLAISHTTKEQRVFGENPNRPGETQYYFNPAGIKSFIIGAVEFNRSMSIAVDSCEKFSCNINLFQNGNGFIKVPVVQGMGFITSIYTNLTPKLESGIGIQRLEQDVSFNNRDIKKYNIMLFNQINWSMYVISNTTDYDFQLKSPNCIMGSGDVQNCIIQLASGNNPLYDQGCGGYPVKCSLSATVDGSGDTANYKFDYHILGNNNKTVMYALPHHVESFASDMQQKLCHGLQLDSTVAGVMQLYLTDSFSMVEKLPTHVQFQPWVDGQSPLQLNQYTSQQLDSIRKLCLEESQEDVVNISNTDSMYSSGKILDKYCMILYVIVFILKDHNLGRQYLPRVRDAMIRFTSNKQQCPLVYDTTWKGIVSSAGLDGDIFRDFGNTHYNDHHFHYGYHIHAAAVLALCDNTIGDGSFMRDYKTAINFLVKDVANPVKDDKFPESRSFDWFNGHSWAKGIFPSFDGKDEESSSEDYHFAYGLKLWGDVIGDKHMENRGNLMLAVMRRAMNMYMLFKDDNKVQPPQMIKNKVSGILFENKMDHATYFGLNLEYIQGIHMLPTTPISSFIRDREFVRQEWEQLLQNHVKTVDDGWKGILMLNLALYNAHESYNFFNDPRFDKRWLDNGMSLTWSLAFSAGVGGGR